MNFRKLQLIAFAAAAMTLAACASTPKASEPEATTVEATDETSCAGPKKRVAILRFGGTGKYGAYEGWDVGEAIAAQMATALEATDCFIIGDRMALSEVLREQELGLAGVVSRDSAPRAGRLLGAQVLIKGEITEFETGKKGNGITAGFGFADIPLGLRLGGNRNVAHVAIDLRLIDAATGEILFSQQISSDAKTYGMSLGVDYKKGSIGTDHFSKTPLGKAIGDASTEAAGFVVQQLYDVDWTGQVIDSQGSQVFVNAGSEAGVKIGDTFTVSNVARELVDPASGVVLGKIERNLGQVRIEAVNDKYSIARIAGNFQVQRGDLLRQ